MNGFIYNNPTEVVFEIGGENKAGEMLKKYGAKKVLVHYGSGSALKSGLIDRITKSIENAGLSYVTLGGVVPNPLLSKVYEGIELCKKEKVDFIIAVGGGSVIDSSKAIGIGTCYDGDVWDLFDGDVEPTESCPVACVLTIAAAGSEMSHSCVITNDKDKLKRFTGTPACRCKFSILNPELTMTLPDYQTASGCVDIIMHTMERYFNNTTNLEITDSVAEAVMKTVLKNAKKLKDNPSDLDARSNVMWGGSLAHNGLTGCGTDGGDWSTHMIEHELGGMFDVTHGAGLAAVWGSWARYVLNVIPHRFAKFAINVLDVEDTGDEKKTALKGIEAMEKFYRYINMPTSIRELGINPTDDQIEEMAVKATHFGKITLGTVLALDKNDIITIYKNAL